MIVIFRPLSCLSLSVHFFRKNCEISFFKRMDLHTTRKSCIKKRRTVRPRIRRPDNKAVRSRGALMAIIAIKRLPGAASRARQTFLIGRNWNHSRQITRFDALSRDFKASEKLHFVTAADQPHSTKKRHR